MRKYVRMLIYELFRSLKIKNNFDNKKKKVLGVKPIPIVKYPRNLFLFII